MVNVNVTVGTETPINVTQTLVSGLGVTTFLDMTDTPASYSGKSLQFARVNAGETGLEFVSSSASVDALDDIGDVVITTVANGEILKWNGTAWINNTLAEADIASATTVSSHTGDATIHFTQASISIPASQITDFDTEVSNNVDVLANTAARHSAVTVTDSSEINFTLAGQDITANIITGSIDVLKLDAGVQTSLGKANTASQPGHTHTASNITDFDTEVSNNTDVAANTSARHSAVTVTDSAEIDFTLTGQNITASLIAGSIDETKLDVSTNASLDLADGAAQKSNNLSDLTNAATAFGNIKQAASDVSAGVVELATNAEALTGTDTTRAITPDDLKYVVDRQKEVLMFAVSDESTALTTGVAKVTFRMPYAMTLTDVRASVTTAPTGANLVVDINESGTSIMTTNKLSIDATEKTSTTATTAAGITDSALADDAEITIDIDTVGSTIAGAGLKVTLIGTRT